MFQNIVGFFSVIYFSIKTTTPTFITGNKNVLGSFMSHDSVGWLGSVGWFFCSLWFQLESLQQLYSAGAHLELGTSLICPTGLWLNLSPAGWFYFFTCESGQSGEQKQKLHDVLGPPHLGRLRTWWYPHMLKSSPHTRGGS